MREHLRRNVVAYLALFVALGGTSYAAVQLPANSVGPSQLRSGSVVGAKLANNSVTGAKVKAGTLMLSDFAPAQRLSLKGPAGPRGAIGATGGQGPGGAPGADGQPGLGALAYTNDVASQATPPAGGVHVVDQTTITMQRAGKLVIVEAVARAGIIVCGASACSASKIGVYVDDAPVPGTFVDIGITVAAGLAKPYPEMELPAGMLPLVSAGSHTIRVQFAQTNGSIGLVDPEAKIVAVATG